MTDTSSPTRLFPSRLADRLLRRAHLLDPGESIVEGKGGALQRWWIDQSEQPVQRHMPVFRGLGYCCYSQRFVFIGWGGRRLHCDLVFIWRIWTVEPRSLCVISPVFPEGSPPQLVCILWRSGENEEAAELTAFADRIRVTRRGRLNAGSAESRASVVDRMAEVSQDRYLEAQARLLNAAGVAAVAEPRTVIGLWLRALVVGEDVERDRLKPLLNGGKATGWNDDEPGVVQAACELAARRYFTALAGPERIAAAAADLRDMDRRASEPQGIPARMPGQEAVEAVLRNAAGEDAAIPADIRLSTLFHIRTVFVLYALTKLDAVFDVDRLICEAEAIAFDRGFQPTQASESVDG
jgi:hypothetical protein